MNRSFSLVAAGAFLIFSSAAVNATLIDFTIPGATSFATIPSSYQPLQPADTITYTGVGVYNGTPDHTSGTSNGNDYYSFPYRTGNGGTELFSFSSPLTVNSFWYGVFDNTDPNVKVVASIYSNTTATGTPLDTLTLTPTFNNTSGPLWAFSGTALSAFSNVQSLTFTTTDGTNDAVNIDDISVTVPEPASLGISAIGVFGLLARRRNASKKQFKYSLLDS